MYFTPKADQFNIADLRGAADIIDERDTLTTYLGFCQPGTELTSEPKFSIMRIKASGTVKPITHTFMWAEGLAAFSHIWDSRAAYQYKFKNF